MKIPVIKRGPTRRRRGVAVGERGGRMGLKRRWGGGG